ncbi:hypothetical protein MMPV_005288 [Pyropia vietnamensis]
MATRAARPWARALPLLVATGMAVGAAAATIPCRRHAADAPGSASPSRPTSATTSATTTPPPSSPTGATTATTTSRSSPPYVLPASPPGLTLRQVHVFTRHGARSPLAPLTPAERWPFCEPAAYPRGVAIRLAALDGVSPPPPLATRRGGGPPGGCFPGQLSAAGAAQMVGVGAALRAAYVGPSKLLPPAGKDRDGGGGGGGGNGGGDPAAGVWVRSTFMERTVESAVCLLGGLFPDLPRVEGVGEEHGGPADAVTAALNGVAACGAGADRDDVASPPPSGVVVRVAPFLEETLFPNSAACGRLRQLFSAAKKRAFAREDTVAKVAAAADAIRGAAAAEASTLAAAAAATAAPSLAAVPRAPPSSGETTQTYDAPPPSSSGGVAADAAALLVTDPIGMRDALVALAEHGAPPPPGMTPALAAGVAEVATAAIHGLMADDGGGSGGDANARGGSGSTETLRLAVGALLGEVLDVASAAGPPDANRRLNIYSAHDTTLLPLLLASGVAPEEWVPYASAVVLEVYDAPVGGNEVADRPVRLLYNGRAVALPGSGGASVTSLGVLQALWEGLVLRPYDTDAACRRVPVEEGEGEGHSREGVAAPTTSF